MSAPEQSGVVRLWTSLMQPSLERARHLEELASATRRLMNLLSATEKDALKLAAQMNLVEDCLKKLGMPVNRTHERP